MKRSAPDGAAFTGVTPPSRRTPAAIALVALAVLAVALLTRQAPLAAIEPEADPTPSSSSAESVASTLEPTIEPTPSPTSGAPSRNPNVTPHPTFALVPAEAGPTLLTPTRGTSARLSITLPVGWEKAGAAFYLKPGGEANAPMSIAAWTLRHVNSYPCRWSTQELADDPLTPTAEGQATALSAWWGQDSRMPPPSNSRIAPLASKPVPTMLQGYPAWYVEVLIPSNLDLTECDGGQPILWDTDGGNVRYSQGPGEIIRLWVVDVAGEVMVIDAAYFLGASSSDVIELKSVLDSLAIEP